MLETEHIRIANKYLRVTPENEISVRNMAKY